ncbi:MAG: CoA transferase, partial [Phyllobacterium sp.]
MRTYHARRSDPPFRNHQRNQGGCAGRGVSLSRPAAPRFDRRTILGNSTPLHGLTVLELGHSVAAPFAGLILADLGARVIKIENPTTGDYARGWGPPFHK